MFAMNKKAQAAMEFLMTYGWAILVVLFAIGALAYFGVLSPARFLPASCTLMPGLGCSNFKVDATGATLIVQNGMGQDLTSFIVSMPCGAGTVSSTAVTLSDGDSTTVTLACALTAGTRFKEELTVGYTDEGGLSHIRAGQLISEVEA